MPSDCNDFYYSIFYKFVPQTSNKRLAEIVSFQLYVFFYDKLVVN